MNEERNIPAIPDSRKAEIQIIADLVSNPGYIGIARGRITRDMFSDAAAAEAWNVLLEMDASRGTIDLSTVGMRIRRDIVAEIVRPEYSFGICGEMTLMSHCTALVQAAFRRKVYRMAQSLVQDSCDVSVPYDSLMVNVSDAYREICGSPVDGRDPEPVREVLRKLGDELETVQARRDEGRSTRVPTGFPFLDTLTLSGFGPGNLVILAARPSVGKTALMLKMARTAAEKGIPACVFSLEMTNEELARRLLLTTGRLNPYRLAAGEIDWPVVEEESARYSDLPLWFNDRPRTIDDVTSGVISAHSRGICEAAFIDYLGLIRGTDRRVPLCQSIAEMTARLKRTAKECGIPIVLLCQLNRNIEAENRPPELRDLRDSGSIEQDADIVLMLERDQSRSGEDSQAINVWVRKNRHGRGGDVVFGLRANRTFTDFEEIRDGQTRREETPEPDWTDFRQPDDEWGFQV